MIFTKYVDDNTDIYHGLEFEDGQEQKVQARKIKSLEGATSYPQEIHTLYSRSKSHTKEKIRTTTSNIGLSNSSNDASKVLVESINSLPRIYNMTSSPSVDEDSDPWRYVNETHYTYQSCMW